MQRSALCRSRRELSNAYLLANFGFDTAENEPSKVWRAPRPSGRVSVPATSGTSTLRWLLYALACETEAQPRRGRPGPRLQQGALTGGAACGGAGVGVSKSDRSHLLQMIYNDFDDSPSKLKWKFNEFHQHDEIAARKIARKTRQT